MPPRIPTAELRRMTLGWRVTTAEYVAMLPFFDTFINVAEAMRWLTSQPQVQAVIDERVASATVQS